MHWGMVERVDLGDEAELTAGVILDSYLRPTQVQGFDQGNRLVGTDLGDGDEGGLVVVHASLFMHRDSIFVATLETHFGHTAVVGSLAPVTDTVGLGTCKTVADIGDQFEDFR